MHLISFIKLEKLEKLEKLVKLENTDLAVFFKSYSF